MAEPLQPDAAASAAASPGRPRPGLAPSRSAYPMRVGDDAWFGAGRLGKGSGALVGPFRLDEASIEAARTRSDQAEALAAKARKVAADAALLRQDAAEEKRLAGVPAEAFEDYRALARHHLATGALKSAIAYMRKALHVADMAGDAETAVAGRLLAAETYVAVRQPDKATKRAKEARDFAEEAGLVDGVATALDLIGIAEGTPKLSGGRCACKSDKRYLQCCGAADTDPVEFSPEALRITGIPTTPSVRHGGWRAMETLMRPEEGTERLTWYAWFVEDGCHRLVSYPNWSGRALRTAERMARIARNEDCAESAAAAVLESFVALESFLVSWKSLRRMEHSRQASDATPPQPGEEQDMGGNAQPSLVARWTETVRATFGSGSALPNRPDFATLAELRNALVHRASLRETLIPAPAKPNNLIVLLEKAGCGIRPAPAPWMDRIMTPDVADWAVRVAKEQIAAVRASWEAVDHADTNREWWLSVAGETDGRFEEDDAFETSDEPPAAPRPDGVERTGLRLIARGQPED